MVDFSNHEYKKILAESDIFAYERKKFLKYFIDSQIDSDPEEDLISQWEEHKVKKLRRVAPHTVGRSAVSPPRSSLPTESVGVVQPKRRGRPPKNAKKDFEGLAIAENDKEKERRVEKWRGEFVPRDSLRAKALKQQALDSKLAAQRALPNLCDAPKVKLEVIGLSAPDPSANREIKLAQENINEEEKRYKRIQETKLRKIRLGAKKRTEEKALRIHAERAEKCASQLVPPSALLVEPKVNGFQIPKVKN